MVKHNPQHIANFIAGFALLAASCAVAFSYLQWQTTQDQEKRQLQAYLSDTHAEIFSWDGKRDLKVDIFFKNYGSTPARNFKLDVATTLISGSDSNLVVIKNPIHQLDLDLDWSFAPSQERFVFFLFSMTADTVKQFNQPGTEFIASGRLSFHDEFGQERTEDFCFGFFGDQVGALKPDDINKQANVCHAEAPFQISRNVT